jgi:hypothetical protein
MSIAITLIVIFILSFLLIFKLVFRENKQESDDEKMSLWMTLFITILFSLLITVGIGLMLFVLLGTTNTVNMIFSLDLSVDELMTLAISIFVYLFTIDSVIEIILKYVMGKNIVYYCLLLFVRIGIFYVIGIIIGISQSANLAAATGVALIVLLIEFLYNLREKNKSIDVKE